MMSKKSETTAEQVEAILVKVRPYIQMHGGDVMLASVADNIVTLKIYGACVGCSLATLTYDRILKPLILEEVHGINDVIIETA